MPIIIDDKIIETPVKDILNALQQTLAIKNIPKLQKIDYKRLNARVCCPIHKGGQEHTPSCDILLEDKGNVSAGTVYCFACGYTASFVKFVANCLDISYRKSKEWLLAFCNYSLIQNNRNNLLDIFKTDIKNTPTWTNEVSLDELKKYDNIHPYMFQRKLTYDIIEKYEVGYDPETESLTFPVYVDGKCLFVAKRRIKYKRFDMPQIYPKPIYGLDYVKGNSVIVCESIINALTCEVYGKEAIALFGTGSKEQIQMLQNIPQRRIILALDGDEAGKNGTKRLKEQLCNKIVTQLVLPIGKDINDLSKEEFYNLEEIF